MRQVRSTSLPRLIALLAVIVALVAGAAACSAKESPEATPDTSTTEPTPTTVPAPVGSLIATAKGPTVVVLAEAPAELRTDSTAGSSTTTTAPARNARDPIPRTGLKSAGVTKVPLGYQFDNPTYFKNPLVMQVLEEHGEWLKVLIQARPNHTEGWVKASDVDVTSTTYRMVLSLADRHLTVFDGDTVVVETDVVIGKDTTPTPLGSFYLSEKIQQKNTAGAYGPWILSTNGYSEALDLFDKGLPVIAFHGTNQPNLIGTQASNGCIRMPNDVVSQLADTLPAGTPIEIVAESLKGAATTPDTTLATAA
jgi:lipoprotein-anchoring transpeptidase ErfK/SrfK